MKGIGPCTVLESVPDYTELRVQENRSCRLSMVNSNIVVNSTNSVSGVSARVYKEGVWGFASNPVVNDGAMHQVIRTASANARYLNTREKKGRGPLPAVSGQSRHDFTTRRPRRTNEELIAFVQEIDDFIVRTCPRVHSRTLLLSSLDIEKELLTSDGSHICTMIPRTFLYLNLAVEEKGVPTDLYSVHGGFGQFEDAVEDAPIATIVLELYDHLLQKAAGVHPDAGSRDCILAADLSGIMAHEAIGHTTEADFVLGGSVASEFLDKQVASPLISLTDYAHTAFGARCPVPVYVDDEGTPARDVPIITRGTLTEYMHSKETAQRFDVTPTGNARAYLFSDEPLIRMRNTAITPGHDTLADMIASIDDGYYLVNASGGQADSTGEFMFGVVHGYEIKHGKLGRAIRNTTISGVAFNVLKTVTMVSDELVWNGAGMCGKKQPLPVAMGGPAIRCTLTVGGK